MTLSENIQLNRKRLDISQEDLGKMMFVSRQTVSMWEKGKTVPTIDNLILLSEIFSISVDELLKGKTSQRAKEPAEKYEFSFSKEELDEIRRQTLPYKKAVRCAVMLSLFLLSVLSEAPGAVSGFVFGVLFSCAVMNIKSFAAAKKAWKNTGEKITRAKYRYEIYGDCMEIEILRDGGMSKYHNIKFSEVEGVTQLKNHFLLYIAGSIFIIRKSGIKRDSSLYTLFYEHALKNAKQSVPPGWKTASAVLFVLSLCSVFLALFLTGYVSGKNHLFVENMWIFFTVTPLPAASAAFGFAARRRGYKLTKNIIAGIIMTLLLCAYGSFVFIF